jgi:hypothetical protein
MAPVWLMGLELIVQIRRHRPVVATGARHHPERSPAR